MYENGFSRPDEEATDGRSEELRGTCAGIARELRRNCGGIAPELRGALERAAEDRRLLGLLEELVLVAEDAPVLGEGGVAGGERGREGVRG